MTPEEIAALTDDQVIFLTELLTDDRIANLTEEQIKALESRLLQLDPIQKHNILMNHQTGESIKALIGGRYLYGSNKETTPLQPSSTPIIEGIKTITKKINDGLADDSLLIENVDPHDIPYVDFTKLNYAEIEFMTPKQIAALTDDQVIFLTELLTDDRIANLTEEQIEALGSRLLRLDDEQKENILNNPQVGKRIKALIDKSYLNASNKETTPLQPPSTPIVKENGNQEEENAQPSHRIISRKASDVGRPENKKTNHINNLTVKEFNDLLIQGNKKTILDLLERIDLENLTDISKDLVEDAKRNLQKFINELTSQELQELVEQNPQITEFIVEYQLEKEQEKVSTTYKKINNLNSRE